VHFLLDSLKVAFVLTTPKPVLVDDNKTIGDTWASMKWEWEQDESISNVIVDSLFDIYQSKLTAKDVSNALKAKYLLEA
jgi:hypothetical protein